MKMDNVFGTRFIDNKLKTTKKFQIDRPNPVKDRPRMSKEKRISLVRLPIFRLKTLEKWRCKSKKSIEPSREQIGLNLGSFVGAVFGTYNLKDCQISDNMLLYQAYATCLIAFGELFITSPKKWDSQVANRVMQEGKCLLNKSIAKLEKNLMLSEDKIDTCFLLCENLFEVAISEPSIIGRLVTDDYRICDFHNALAISLSNRRYFLVQINNLYMLMWKKDGAVFLYDPHGRLGNCESDLTSGYAGIICLRNIDNLSHLIINMSHFNPDDKYSVREIKMIRIIPCCKKLDFSKVERKIKFEVQNPNHAILQARFHLGSKCFDDCRFQQGLAVAYIAILYSKIDPSATWDQNILEKILIMGNRYFKSWTGSKPETPLCIHGIPWQINIGQFQVRANIFPTFCCGTWFPTLNFSCSKFVQGIKSAFEKSNNLIIRVATRHYAVWKRMNLFYILNPYPLEYIFGKESKLNNNATLHLCLSMEYTCYLLTQHIIKNSSSSSFEIHYLKIIKIDDQAKILPLLSHKERFEIQNAIKSSAEDTEVASLNESILELSCEKELNCLGIVEKQKFEQKFADLDSPALSETQFLQSNGNIKKEIYSNDNESGDDSKDIASILSITSSLDSSHSREQDRDSASDDLENLANISTLSKRKRPKSSKSDTGEGGSGGRKRADKSQKDDDAYSSEDKEKDRKRHDKRIKAGSDSSRNKAVGTASDKLQLKSGDDPSNVPVGDFDGFSGLAGGKEELINDVEGLAGGIGGFVDGIEGVADGTGIGTGGKNVFTDGIGGLSAGGLGGIADRMGGVLGGLALGGLESLPADERESIAKLLAEGKLSEIDPTVLQVLGIVGGQHQRVSLSNSYPGYSYAPYNIGVVGSKSGTFQSLCKLLSTALRCTDRVLTMTPWGNYVVFRQLGSYLLYDGCTCNVCRFRHLDLTVGTAGLLSFSSLHSIIQKILKGQLENDLKNIKTRKTYTVEEICNEYCH